MPLGDGVCVGGCRSKLAIINFIHLVRLRLSLDLLLGYYVFYFTKTDFS